MVRLGISRRGVGCRNGKLPRLRPGAKVHAHDPAVYLRDPKFIQAAILEALQAGDYESVIDIYRAHLRVLNRTRTASALKVSRQYVHKMLKTSNTPSLRTFTAFMKMLALAAPTCQPGRRLTRSHRPS